VIASFIRYAVGQRLSVHSGSEWQDVSVIEPPELTDEEQLGNGPSRTQPPPAAARTRSIASDGAGRVADAGGAGGAGGAAENVRCRGSAWQALNPGTERGQVDALMTSDGL
jgi:hypothetical protein